MFTFDWTTLWCHTTIARQHNTSLVLSLCSQASKTPIRTLPCKWNRSQTHKQTLFQVYKSNSTRVGTESWQEVQDVEEIQENHCCSYRTTARMWTKLHRSLALSRTIRTIFTTYLWWGELLVPLTNLSISSNINFFLFTLIFYFKIYKRNIYIFFLLFILDHVRIRVW